MPVGAVAYVPAPGFLEEHLLRLLPWLIRFVVANPRQSYGSSDDPGDVPTERSSD